MSASNILGKTENAARDYIVLHSNLAGVTIHAGATDEAYHLPAVVAYAKSASEHIPMAGQYEVDLVLEVLSSADDDTPATHQNRVAAIGDLFMWDGAALSLSAGQTNYSAVGVVPGEQNQDFADRRWSTTLEFMIHCRAS